jgi:hypothetical protein
LHLGGVFTTQFTFKTPSATPKCKISPFAYFPKNYIAYGTIFWKIMRDYVRVPIPAPIGVLLCAYKLRFGLIQNS